MSTHDATPAPEPRAPSPLLHWEHADDVSAAFEASFALPELARAILNAKRKSAPGADGITYQAIGNLDNRQRSRLFEFYNHHWTTGTLPEEFGLQLIAPILKKNKLPNLCSSFRPISLTSAASKIMELTALARPQWYARKHNLNPEQQTAFRSQRSAMNSIEDLSSALEHEKATKTVIFAVLLAIRRAFDCLPHETIHAAIDRCKIAGKIRAYLKAFIRGR